MKLLKVKKQDAKPSIRIKAAGNVFVEVCKDNKGYFYRIDVPGATDFVSKERFENQDKARLAGVTHAKKFISKVKGDQKKTDSTAFQKCKRWADELEANASSSLALPNFIANHCKGMDLHEADEVNDILEEAEEKFEAVLKNIKQARKVVEAQG